MVGGVAYGREWGQAGRVKRPNVSERELVNLHRHS